MEQLVDRIALVQRHVSRAVEAVNGDPGASPVLRAVVLVFQLKTEKTLAALGG